MTRSRSTTIEATYRIVTPMFCRGADQTSAELRVPSFKGALRFWWRSLMWGQVRDHRELQQKEAELFGASNQQVGQSRVSLRISDRHLIGQMAPGEVVQDGKLAGVHYLGYGVMEAFDGKNTKAGRLTRAMISGGQFAVSCRFSRLADLDQIDEVRRALILLGTVGGLGSKARKGFGSLTLTSLVINEVEEPVSNLLPDRFRSVLCPLCSELPEWTAWSNSSKVVAYSTDQKHANLLLDHLGRALSQFRGWIGRDDSKFPNDHDLLFDYLKSSNSPSRLPARVAFGLPHNYFFRSLSDPPRRNVKAEVTPEKKRDGSGLTRRGSPLFLHIHDTGDSTPTAVVAFLPARFLPQPARVTISDTSSGKELHRKRHHPVTLDIVEDGFWKPIEAFLQRIQADESTNAKEVPLG